MTQRFTDIAFRAAVFNLWSADLPGGPRAKCIYLYFKDINTQTDQFWQISLAQLTVVVYD